MFKPKKDFTLREKKYAKTKIALANAFIERLKKTKFSEISIKEVCESVEVSEGTFFNYFPQKVDVVFYYKQIIGLKISWEIKQSWGKKSPWALIEFTFNSIASELSQPYLFYEIISLFTAERKKSKEMALIPAEKFYANPGCGGIEDIPVELVEETLLALIKEAKQNGEFKEEIKPEEILLALMTILVGVPLAINIEDFGMLKKYYRLQLAILWKAVGVN